MNKTSYIFLFLSVFIPDSLLAQYYKSNGFIDDEKIILELKKYDSDYAAQDSVANFFVRWILNERINGELALRSEIIKNVASITVQQIGSRRGKYEFLSMDFRNWRDVPRNEVGRDTVDSRISLLEKTWDRYLDSIQVVSSELFDIANNIRVTREGRDQAARLLGRTNDPEMMDYIFKNDRHYRFGGFIDNPYSWEDCWGCNRSALGGLVFDKITRYQNNYGGEEPKIRNWSLFPLFIKYWGDSDYDLYVQTVPYSGDALEAMAFIKLVENYKMPWLVYEFLVANAVDPNTKILKLLGKLYLDEKEYYESRQPIPTEK